MLKKGSLILAFTLLVSLTLGSTVLAADAGEFVDPDIPESWYEAPQTASEVGIEEFHQSPELKEKVENGELPPVEKRLPADPPVIEPYNEVGEYGGTITVWHTTLNDNINYDGQFAGNMRAVAAKVTPDGTEVVPFLIKGWEHSNNSKELTLHLRKGLKFSNGDPLTADDYMYWWKYEANNKDLAEVLPENWEPGSLLNVKKLDDYTVKYVFEDPNPRVAQYELNQYLTIGAQLGPRDFMKKFHPEFTDKEKIDEMVNKEGLDTWDQLYDRVKWGSINRPESSFQRPVIYPYIVTEREEDYLILERNPYYPFVDTEGNQLPYVDRIRVRLANNAEVASTQAATGNATYASRNLNTSDIPLYKKNAQEEGFKTLLYSRPWTSDVLIHFNLNHKEEQIREIFQNVKFRKAASLAIDREDINKKVYYGSALPQQAAQPPTHSYYKEEHAEAYADYDPERAKEMLDEIGLKDQNGDGYRELPNGDSLKLTFIHCKMGAVDPTSILELVHGDFEDVGLNINLKKVSEGLHHTRVPAGNFDICGWTGDMMTDLNFGDDNIGRNFAPIGANHLSPWPLWANWYTSGGEEGVEPPQKVKKLIDAAEKLRNDPDEEARREAGWDLVEAQAENLWAIGTVTMAPQPIIVSENLKNVPSKGLWDAKLNYMNPMFPIQFYLEE